MSHDWMEYREMKQAVDALYNWFESQDINPPDAIVVMALAISAIIGTGYNEKSRQDTVAAVANLIAKGSTKEAH